MYVALQKLNRWKASGVDGITNHLLKLCAKHIDVPLAHVFNLSLRSGRFPATWKQARVQPVFKQKGDRSSPRSYRPIALLCSVSKVFETLVKDQVLSFCLANRVLPDSQFGFLPGRSTVWQLLSVLDDWHAARERGTSVHAAFLDLAKAFDRVDHQILIKKLASSGLSSTCVDWFKSYLTGRTIVTTVDHVDSSPLCISSGVPQGSVLGPILFIIYMADLPVAVKQNTCALFADDTLVYSTCCKPSQHPCCNLQEDIDAVQTRSSDWNATFNSAKSQQMVVGRHGCETGENLVLGGDKLQQVCTVSHLGLTLASTLKWSDHLSGILKRAAPKAAALKKLGYRARVSVDTMSLLYKTLLRPRLEYASIAWDNCSAADSRRLERLQLSVARAVMHQRRHPSMSKSQLLKQLGWPTLAWRRRRAKLIYFWKLVNNQGPPCLSSRIPKSVNNRCEYSLRNTGTVELPACSSSLYLSSFIPSSCLLWNSLPPDVSSCSSVSSFTLMLDSHFSFDRFTLGLS